MQYGSVAGINKPISRIVQGIVQVPVNEEEKAFAYLDMMFEMGVNCVDTARIYGNSDACLGKWVRTRNLQDKVVILAKGQHPNQYRNKVTPYDIGADLHDTLGAMGLDHVDLYVLHRDDPTVPVGPIIDALNLYVKEGKIGAFGGSNWTTERLEEANNYASQTGQIPFAVSSPNYSLAEQVDEPWGGCVTISGPKNEAAREWYATHNISVFPWSSMASGFWSGRFTRNDYIKEGYHEEIVKRCYCTPENFDRLERATELAAAKGLTLPQIALSFVLSNPMKMFPLVGSANKEELQANIDALLTPLTQQEMDWLDLKADSPGN